MPRESITILQPSPKPEAKGGCAPSGGYAACVAELFALSVEADETLRACKAQGDDEGRIEHRGRRDAYNHALEIVKRHNH